MKIVENVAYQFLNDRIHEILKDGMPAGKNDGNPLYEYKEALFVLNTELNKILEIHDLL
jgi:hypothetical protein